MAIVPYQANQQLEPEFVALVCTEMPETRFEDVVRVRMNRMMLVHQPIDDIYLGVCEPGTVMAVSAVPDHPAAVGVRVQGGNTLIVETDRAVDWVTVKLTGIRKGHTQRFRRYTRDEMERNLRFWDAWRNW